MKFRPSLSSEVFIEDVHQRIGARNKAVLGRSALFLALGEGVPPAFKPADSQGKDLDDDTVIGDDLRDLIRAALNHRAGKELDEAGYRQAFRQYFEYGCQRLKQIWEDSGRDQAGFAAALLRLTADSALSPPRAATIPIVEMEVQLKVLMDGPLWSLNGEGTKNGLLVISGEPGSGKSQLALDLLAQLGRQGVRFIFFDLKGELEDDPSNPKQSVNREQFFELTGARYLRLIPEGFPINPLIRDSNTTVNAQIAYEIANLIRCFAPQLGRKQEESICDAYQKLARPDFPSLAGELERSGASGVDLSIIRKIERYNLFARAAIAMSPEEWLSTSIVVDFRGLGTDNEAKALTVALILNFLIKRMNQNLPVKGGVQPLKMVLFVDEAHLLLPKEGKAGLLGSLARQGRSWGFPVWLASQDADAFMTSGENATNFAELAECGIHFSPHTLSDAEQRRIMGGVVNRKLKKAEGALRLQGGLVVGPVRQFWKDRGK